MLIKNCICCVAIFISLISIPILIYSIKNKDRNICKYIIYIDIIHIVYLFIDLTILPFVLYVEIGLEILFLDLFAVISGIFYIISIVLNAIKMKKIKMDVQTKPKKVIIVCIIFIVLPVLLFSASILRNKYLISNSDLILVYYSSGNGGLGDGETFAYAIGEDFCEQFDLGIVLRGYELQKFLPQNAVEIVDINDVEDYKIIIDNNSILVYKDDQCICQSEHNYFNIKFEKGFYIKHN